MPRLVAIVGGSGAGKTWLATQIQTIYGEECARLCLDSFYRDRSHLSRGQRDRLNFDHPRAIDWPLVENTLDQCLRARSVWVPRYDFAEHKRVLEGDWWQPKSLVLVEGLWLLHRPALRRQFSFSIFLDCPEQTRLERRLRRDVMERGRTPESVQAQFQRKVSPMHQQFVAPQSRWADICLSGTITNGQLNELLARLSALVDGGVCL